VQAYTAFRYAPPLTAAALSEMAADGVTRAVAFSQYPQYSCTTTGSSLNHLWREAVRLGLDTAFRWSVIDRWHSHPGFLAAVARRVALGLSRFPAGPERDRVVIVFSAHSLPMLTVNKGDAYVPEVAATVNGVMALIRGEGVTLDAATVQQEGGGGAETIRADRNPYILAWQVRTGL
jgi:protoporphyrin/coproporphyrin ferrochelatase